MGYHPKLGAKNKNPSCVKAHDYGVAHLRFRHFSDRALTYVPPPPLQCCKKYAVKTCNYALYFDTLYSSDQILTQF